MAIPEDILEKWSLPGSNGKANHTYKMIKTLITENVSDTAPLLQGSYANGTNVREGNAIDVLVMFKDWKYNTKRNDDVKFARDFLYNAINGKDGLEFLRHNKSVRFMGNEEYLPVHIVPCARYMADGEPGIVMFDIKAGKYTIGYPMQHKKFGEIKDEDTDGNYKNAVRMFKSARDYAVRKGLLERGVFPSQGLESLLYNVPDEEYSGGLHEIFFNVFMWLYNNPSISDMVRQNNIQPLFGDSISAWNIKDARTSIDRMSYLWGTWEKTHPIKK